MKLRLWAAASLAFLVINAAIRQPAHAQFGNLAGGQASPAVRGPGAARYYQASRMQVDAHPPGGGPATVQSDPQPQLQPQPQRATSGGGPADEELPLAGAYNFDGYSGDYFDGGYDSCDGCEPGCCDTCGGYGNSCSCICPPGYGGYWSRGHYFITSDYLFARANFSDAIAFLSQDDSQQALVRDDFRQLNFQHESSYRFGGGYRICDCGDEIRFLFTRLSSYATETAPEGTFVPYDIIAEPGGQTFILADVDVKSYDVSFAKKIPLGEQTCGGCGDGCGGGCGDACGCPTWEITWSGGFRFADVDWNRTFIAVDEIESFTARADAVMNFRGGGPRIGLEGRRYFFDGGMMSIYMKGDISLLLGDLSLLSQASFDNGTAPNTENFQTLHCRHIIPVTELETGLTGQLTNNATLTTGYLFSAWHDLGFRDQFNFPTALNTSYDDANILGFDGFFARLEVAF